MNNCTSLKKEALERGYNPNFSNLCPSQSWSVSKETTDVTVTRGMDALDRQSIMTLTLLHEFVYEFRGNNTYIIQGRTALDSLSEAILDYAIWQKYPNFFTVSRSGLVAGYPPLMPFYSNWVDTWRHLSREKQLKRVSKHI